MEENKTNKPQNEEKKKKNAFVSWWTSLPKAAKIATSSVAGLGVISAVVFPILGATVWNKGGSKPVDPTPTKEWYEYDDWYNRTSNATSNDIGRECEVLVNNVKHKVRLIDVDKDKYDDNGTEKTAHTTWEFANLISDSDGYSLGYQWNDASSIDQQNRDYSNSSIRKILCGSGIFTGNVYCATKSSCHSSTESENGWDSNYTYTTDNPKTIFSMLPLNLQSTIKKAIKKVRGTDMTTPMDCSDKLFLLSQKEMGGTDTADEGEVYEYYKNPSDEKNIKKQVKGAEQALTDFTFIKVNNTTKYKDSIDSCAGHNSTEGGGGDYWIRSPYDYLAPTYMFGAWCVYPEGTLGIQDYGSYAKGVAPAFCI